MNKYSLDTRPSSYYLEQFREERIEILPYLAAGMYKAINGKLVRVEREGMHFSERQEQGIHKIQADFFEFDIYFPSRNSKIDSKFIAAARTVLSCVVELDQKARSVPSSDEYEEHLAYIDISEEEIELHYFASTVNTEWGAYFTFKEDGTWEFQGLG